MAEELAVGVGPSKIDMAYERFGDPGDPPVLLIMGGGAQMINWPEGFCDELVARGLHVIRFDNRDVGRSTHFTAAPPTDIRAAMAGDLSGAVYDLSDMAGDAVGLLDAIDLGSVHVVGASMGGMIAQTIAIEAGARVRSLTTIMSTTGNPEVGRTSPGAFGDAGPQPDDRAGYIDWQVRSARASASPGFVFDAAAVAERAGRTFDRGVDFEGMMRQMVAVLVSGDRTARLAELDIPTLVLHGADDRIFDVSGGRAIAEAIPGAKLVVFDGMSHNLPRELWPVFADHITELVRHAESVRMG
ncbi:alpha/beta fold hydrolase [Nocardia sp. NPDC057668]|uniref:alpha/beta fold hydrolase n=1 Tax=Nocardia sp. NPDC057668 TaxID=3346202 RepID=UPI00366D0FB8